MDAKDRNRESALKRSRRISSEARNIHRPPPRGSQYRRDEGRHSLKRFCELYLASIFVLRWSPDHIVVLEKTEEVIRHGGKEAFAMPRGSGKTSICEAAVLKASLYGEHPFTMLIAVSATRASEILQSIKIQLLTNELLFEDFPEVCHAVRALEDRANKCKGQHIDGQSTYISWSRDRVVFPSVRQDDGAWFPTSGCVLGVGGLTSGSIRGPKFTQPHSGRTVRPTLALVDDPQDDESAHSPAQCQKLHRLLHAAVSGMAGPGKKLSVVLPGTVIAKGDFMDCVLNREVSPLWNGMKFKLIDRMPANMEMWEEYGRRRKDEIRNGGNGHLATAWYGQNRAAMDEGAMAAWPERFNDDELGPVQHAMNLYFLDPASFFSEYQNDPMPEEEAEGQLKPELVAARTVNIDRGIVPVQTTKLIAAVDVQKEVLFWSVQAFWGGLGGHVVDYGTWPDQQRRYFRLNEVQHTISRAMALAGLQPGKLEGQLKFALDKLSDQLLGHDWAVQVEGVKKIDRMIVDAGFEVDTIKTWCLNTKHAAIVTPWHGRAVKSTQKPWSQYPVKPGEEMGFHTLLTYGTGKNRIVKHMLGDSYFWKTLVCRRLQMTIGDPSAITLFKPGQGQDHRMLADHYCSEYFKEAVTEEHRVNEWNLRVEHADNHWWDTLVMGAAGASFAGVKIEESQANRPRPKPIDIEEEYRWAQGA